MKKVLLMVSCLALMLSAGMLVAQDKGKKGKATVVANAAKGKTAFESYCSGCHKLDTDDHKVSPPGLKAVTKRPKLVNEEPMNDANLAKFINEGGNGMPPFSDLITTQEKADIVAFLKTI